MRKDYNVRKLGGAGTRLVCLLLLAGFCHLGAAAQDAKISISMKGSVKEVLKKIESLSSYRFFYSDDIAFVNSAASVDYSNAPVKEVLTNVFKGSNLTFKLMDNDAIVITPFGATASNKVTGTVTDETGAPMPGVNVVIKGTQVGTVTNTKGGYSIDLPAGKSQTLLFSFLGCIPEEKSVAGGTTVNVKLQSDVQQLESIVMIGYGAVKKKDLTGAVSSISGDAIANAPVATAAEAITGRIAGVQVINTEGNPDAEVLIRVRGGGSISQDNSPLYVVDGFVNDEGLTGVNPGDIESIDVLKDASSTAIYGARGANGVVIVTTKKGEIGKSKVNYNGYYGVKQITKYLDVLSPYEFVLAQYEMSHNPDASSSAQTNFLSRFGTWDQLESYKTRKGVNWQEEMFGNVGRLQNHDVSVSGGTKGTKYMVKYNFYDEKGIMVYSSTQRDYLKFSLDQEVNKRLTLNVNANYTDKKTIGGFISGSQDKGQLGNTITYRPVPGIGSNDDDLINSNEDDWADNLTNPVDRAKGTYKKKTYRTTSFSGTLKYKIIKDLTFSLSGSMNTGNNRVYEFLDEHLREIRLQGGPEGTITQAETQRITETALLNYTRTFNKRHVVSAMLGQEISKYTYSGFGAGAQKFSTSDIGLANLSMGAVPMTPASDVYVTTSSSFFGRVDYSLDDKYLANVSLRKDGSSKFGPENKWGYFPSAAVAWRLSEEQFIKDLNVFYNLKLRFGYGMAGNDRIPNDLYASTFQPTYYAASGNAMSNALYPDGIAYPALKWETTITRNLGLDMGFLKGKLSAVVEVYWNDTRDLLLNARIPSYKGYTKMYKNIGSTENKGIEITLNSINISNKNFRWTTDFNLSINRGRIKQLNNDELGAQKSFLENSNWAKTINDFIVQVGQPVGMIYGYVSDGFYTADDFDSYDAATNTWKLKAGVPYFKGDTKVSPGDIKFKRLGEEVDENGNPVITPDTDRKIIGNTNPKLIGGLNNSFNYKGIDLNVVMNFSYGNKILNANKIVYANTYSAYKNMLGFMKDRFTLINSNGEYITDLTELAEVNKNAKTFRASYGSLPRYVYSDAVEDGSFLRLQSITLGYTFPKKWMEKARIQNLRVYATAYNIWTWTNYTGYDPEVSALRSNPLTPGVDYSAYPKSSSFIFGLNITF